MADKWQPGFIHTHLAYEIFSWLPVAIIDGQHWPNWSDYSPLLPTLYNSLGKKIQFVAANQHTTIFNQSYEPRIYLYGEVATRDSSWHDFFNALVWYTFPNIKAVLNNFQYHQLIKRYPTTQRSALENLLTIFDESGVIIASSDNYLLDLIRTMQWKELFWHNRAVLPKKLRCYIIGHSLYEKLLNPYIGLVGHSLLLKVTNEQLNLVPPSLNNIQYQTYEWLKGEAAILNPSYLYPIPLLGLPQWHPATAQEAFYDNQHYFRSTRFIKRIAVESRAISNELSEGNQNQGKQ